MPCRSAVSCRQAQYDAVFSRLPPPMRSRWAQHAADMRTMSAAAAHPSALAPLLARAAPKRADARRHGAAFSPKATARPDEHARQTVNARNEPVYQPNSRKIYERAELNSSRGDAGSHMNYRVVRRRHAVRRTVRMSMNTAESVAENACRQTRRG